MPTETEAKTKWCPFARSPDTEDAEAPICATNRTFKGRFDSSHLCLGSECMAWRWTGSSLTYEVHRFNYASAPPLLKEPERPAEVPPDWNWFAGFVGPDYVVSPCWVEPEASAKARGKPERQGFCGLAGGLAR